MRAWPVVLNHIVAWGTAALVFLLPWQTRWIVHAGQLNGGPWEYGTLSLLATELLLWVLVVGWLLAGGWKKITTVPLPAAAVGLLAWVIMSGWWVIDISAWQQSVRVLIDGILLYTLITVGPLPYTATMISFIAGVGLQATWAWEQFMMQQIVSSSWLGVAVHRPDILGDAVVESSTGRWLRPYGGFPHPNILGGWLAAAWVGVLSITSQIGQQRSRRWFIVSAWLLLGMGLMISFSRSAWLAAGSIALVFGGELLLRRQWQRIYTVLVVSIVLLGTVWGAMYAPLISTRLQAAGRIETISLDTRQQLWQWGAELVNHHWLTGVGLGNATAAVYTTINSQLPAWQYQPPHSVYLTVLVELGVVGALLVAWVMGSIIWRCRQNFIMLAPWLAVVIIGLFDHYPWTLSAGSWLWWLTAALAIRAVKK